MPTLSINGEHAEARPGETILEAARERGSNVWFLCDGRGLCLTCECRVLSGNEHLNPLTELETSALGDDRRQSGYRLACQARVMGKGEVSVLSRAEELRRQFVGMLVPSEGSGRLQNATDLLNSSVEVTMDLVGSIPHLARNAIGQLIDSPPTIERATGYARDSLSLLRHLFGA